MNYSHAPSILEINTWPWLAAQSLTLDSLKPTELETLVRGRDYLWLMGLWERSATGRTIARTHPGLQYEYRSALPDYTPADVVGSAYAIRNYSVDPALGSEAGLARVRRTLNALGSGLMVDFIPNHAAVDAHWVEARPDWFIPCGEKPGNECFVAGSSALAHGRDPYFAPWTDTAQFDYASPQAREGLKAQLFSLAERADGVRCDMAMLMLREVFERTWNRDPGVEFWAEAIAAVKARYPSFVFIAEAYWGLEWKLMQLGFDFCYDKTLYDRLRTRNAPGVAAHLRADPQFSNRVVRFSENHDEPPALQIFGRGWWSATLLCATVPGAFLEYLGQGERTMRLPVQLGRAPQTVSNPEARAFLDRLAIFRRTLGEDFTVNDCPTPQVVSYRRGAYTFFINLAEQGVQFNNGTSDLLLPASGAMVLQESQAEVQEIDWLRMQVA